MLVATSELYQTNSVVVLCDDGACLLVDPGVTAGELGALADELSARRLVPEIGFATHAHWDHLLWDARFGDVPRHASARAVAMAAGERDALLAELQAAAPGHDLDLFARLVPLPAAPRSAARSAARTAAREPATAPGFAPAVPASGAMPPAGEAIALPWSGPRAVAVVHDGHAPGHAAVLLEEARVLLAGDMCSDVEIPLLDWRSPSRSGRTGTASSGSRGSAASTGSCRGTALPRTRRHSGDASTPTGATSITSSAACPSRTPAASSHGSPRSTLARFELPRHLVDGPPLG